jgi:hypothetical protein
MKLFTKSKFKGKGGEEPGTCSHGILTTMKDQAFQEDKNVKEDRQGRSKGFYAY